MTPELRKKLLERVFSSREYYLRMMDYYEKALNGALEAMEWFESNVPTDDPGALKTAYAWKHRALPNMLGYLKGKEEDLYQYDKGDPDYVSGTAHNIMTLSRNLDHVGDKWWDYVPLDIARKFGVNLSKAEQMASNIAWTLGGVFKARDSILDEEITGPVDEQELLKHLKPGESIDE